MCVPEASDVFYIITVQIHKVQDSSYNNDEKDIVNRTAIGPGMNEGGMVAPAGCN